MSRKELICCPNCGHPLNNQEVSMGFCQNCREDIKDDMVIDEEEDDEF